MIWVIWISAQNHNKGESLMKISLCIPTNGIIEWISQVIDSIYSQDVPFDQFEVVIVDNGNNDVFFDYIQNKKREYPNIKYKRIKCSIFMNEIEAYKLAEGDFIKFVNHRTVLLDGTLKKWISFMEENYDTKPVVYFANGELNLCYRDYCYNSFNDFIGALSYYSSWSTGMAMWKEDLVDLNMNGVNELFPHTSILFKRRKSRGYVIDNRIYLREIPHTAQKKGRYDLFYAFAVEYPALLLELYRDGDIEIDTFLKIKEDNLDFIMGIYEDFCEKKHECSYDLSSYDSSIEIFYSHEMLKDRAFTKKVLFDKELKHRIEKLKSDSDAKIIYGAGITGREYITKNGSEDVICFVDKSKYKQGRLILGIPVISYEEFAERNIDAKIIICVKQENFQKEEFELKNKKKDYLYWGIV